MVRKALVIVVLAATLLGGCGGSEASEEPTKPTSVTADDLDKNGDLWIVLTPDLKDELIELGKTRLAADRPDGATGIQAAATGDLVAEVDKQYANESKRATPIFETYRGANDTFAKAGLNDALNQLNQLCSSEPRPPECDE